MSVKIGQHLSDERRALLESLIISKAPYSELRTAGFGSSTVAACRRRLTANGIIGGPVGTDARRAGIVRYYLLTAAQDDTAVHVPFWSNLLAYARFLGAEILVGGFTYQKGLFEDHAVTTGKFSADIAPYLRPEIVELAPRCIWYGRANILPTASDPLAGWDTQTRDAWAVFPHAKIALKSIPVMPGRPGKQIMTTGVATVENYVQRNAGQKAEFHHTIGATIVEVRADGQFWCRQIAATKDGSFQDLDVVVRGGQVSAGNTVEAVTWGDIHVEWEHAPTAAGSWGIGGAPECGSILDTLKPRFQFFHDIFDFTARSHHTRNDPHEKARRVAEEMDVVEDGINAAARFLDVVKRPWCQSVAVFSNHDGHHLAKWLKDPNGGFDAVNAYYWHRMNAAFHDAIRAGDDSFMVHEYALRAAVSSGLDGVTFLREGESFLISQGIAPIECGLHAHNGPRGARGSAASLSKIVERINAAHVHEPTIREGAYFAGVSGRTDMPYATRGPGAQHHAHIITYPNGKRTIVTMHEGDWRA